MPDDIALRHRPDGSIDTAFYMDRARRLRSCQAHDLLSLRPKKAKGTNKKLRRIFG